MNFYEFVISYSTYYTQMILNMGIIQKRIGIARAKVPN